MTRYSMTITEAVELVIQAGASAAKEVLVLDMGDPVRITTSLNGRERLDARSTSSTPA